MNTWKGIIVLENEIVIAVTFLPDSLEVDERGVCFTCLLNKVDQKLSFNFPPSQPVHIMQVMDWVNLPCSCATRPGLLLNYHL